MKFYITFIFIFRQEYMQSFCYNVIHFKNMIQEEYMVSDLINIRLE